MTYRQLVAEWVATDYRSLIKRYGPAPQENHATIAWVLRQWYEGRISASSARLVLELVVTHR